MHERQSCKWKSAGSAWLATAGKFGATVGGPATTMVAHWRQTRWRKIDTSLPLSPHSRTHCYCRAWLRNPASRRRKMDSKFDPPGDGSRPMNSLRNLSDSRLALTSIGPDAAGWMRGTISAAETLRKSWFALDEVYSARPIPAAGHLAWAVSARRCSGELLRCDRQPGRIPVFRQLDRRAAQYPIVLSH